jgi:hypothetical protein
MFYDEIQHKLSGGAFKLHSNVEEADAKSDRGCDLGSGGDAHRCAA